MCRIAEPAGWQQFASGELRANASTFGCASLHMTRFACRFGITTRFALVVTTYAALHAWQIVAGCLAGRLDVLVALQAPNVARAVSLVRKMEVWGLDADFCDALAFVTKRALAQSIGTRARCATRTCNVRRIAVIGAMATVACGARREQVIGRRPTGLTLLVALGARNLQVLGVLLVREGERDALRWIDRNAGTFRGLEHLRAVRCRPQCKDERKQNCGQKPKCMDTCLCA